MNIFWLVKKGTLLLLSYLSVKNSMIIKEKYTFADYLFLYGTSFGLFICIQLWIRELYRPIKIIKLTRN